MMGLRMLALLLTLLVYAAVGLAGLLSVLVAFVLWQLIYRLVYGCWQSSAIED